MYRIVATQEHSMRSGVSRLEHMYHESGYFLLQFVSFLALHSGIYQDIFIHISNFHQLFNI